MTDFQSFKLNEKILHSLSSKGYTNPTPIQEAAIPQILEGRDFLGIAQTGTGKTAAFALPTLHLLHQKNEKTRPNCIRALILTPTRELASQVAESFAVYGKNLHLNYATIYGGISEVSQIKAMKHGVDILIATPGRLLDLTNQGHIEYSQLEMFILDEADRMLDMGFIDDIKKIIAKLPKNRQTLFFSATMPPVIETLANSILNDPLKAEITPQSTTVEKIAQKVHLVSKANKAIALYSLLKNHDIKATLIFCQMKHSANRLSQFLDQQKIDNAVLHGNKSQAAREKALKSFRDGKCKILIATDIAARGIDIPEISHVINYDLPRDIENYVHRIGRTARAGRDGVAISLCDATELKSLRQIEKAIGMKIPVEESQDLVANEENISSRVVGVRLSKGQNGNFEPNQTNEIMQSNNQAGGHVGRKISSGQNSTTRTIFKDNERFSIDDPSSSRPTERNSPNQRSRSPRRDSDGQKAPRRDSFSARSGRSSDARRGDVERSSGSNSARRERSSSARVTEKEIKKTGILQKIFGSVWGKKDSRSSIEEGVSKRFISKNSAGSFSSDGYQSRNSRDSRKGLSSKEPNYAKKKPFFSRRSDSLTGKPRRGGNG